MATRGTIRDAFMAEVRSAVSGTIPSDDVSLQGAEDDEVLPQVVYNDNYRELPYNKASASPDEVERDNDGDVVAARWKEYMEAQFLVQIRDTDEIQKESIYEDVRTAFGAYQNPLYGVEIGKHPKDLHSDVIDVRVLDADSNDAIDEDDVIRGDNLEIRIAFFRSYELTSGTDVGVIEQINHEVDADTDDGTTGKTYTTT